MRDGTDNGINALWEKALMHDGGTMGMAKAMVIRVSIALSVCGSYSGLCIILPGCCGAAGSGPALLATPKVLLLFEPWRNIHATSRTLEAQDEFMQLKSTQILTILLSSESTPRQHLQPFLKVLASLIQGQSSNKRDVAVQCLEALLARPDCRRAVWAIPGIIAGFVLVLLFHLSCAHFSHTGW